MIFDEGSQVSQAHFSALATLGVRILVAGDPEQLGPVVVSDSGAVERWLGRSPFELRAEDTAKGMVFLDEQNRMAGPICDLVAHVFYRGRLRLAEGAASDRRWRVERQVPEIPRLGPGRLHAVRIPTEGGWHAGWKGPIREDSAKVIVTVCQELRAGGTHDIVVLTPFRAQRQFLTGALKRAGVKDVPVWTVHRAQGSEHHTVIFDPVIGSSKFLATPAARRLINVALSRAKARIVLTLSELDETNPTLRDAARIIRGEPLPHMRGFVPVEDYLRGATGYEGLVGRRVAIGDFEGEVIAVSGASARLRLTDASEREFDLAVWAAAAGRR